MRTLLIIGQSCDKFGLHCITFNCPGARDIHNGLAFEHELEKLWSSYCLGETSVFYERFQFNNRNKIPDESIDAFAAALHDMAATCNCGNL